MYIIYFKEIITKCQYSKLLSQSSNRAPGFLLLELLSALLMATISFSIIMGWQGIILRSRAEACARLHAISSMRTLCETLSTEPRIPEKGYKDEDTLHITWHREPVIVPELYEYMPFIKQPLDSFYLITMEACWEGANHIQRKGTIISAGEFQ